MSGWRTAMQAIAIAVAILRRESTFKFTLSTIASIKTNMKTPIPVRAVVAGPPPAPMASAQGKPAKSVDRRIAQMRESMKEMQQQMK
jgi:hypothetical protein